MDNCFPALPVRIAEAVRGRPGVGVIHLVCWHQDGALQRSPAAGQDEE